MHLNIISGRIKDGNIKNSVQSQYFTISKNDYSLIFKVKLDFIHSMLSILNHS